MPIMPVPQTFILYYFSFFLKNEIPERIIYTKKINITFILQQHNNNNGILHIPIHLDIKRTRDKMSCKRYVRTIKIKEYKKM